MEKNPNSNPNLNPNQKVKVQTKKMKDIICPYCKAKTQTELTAENIIIQCNNCKRNYVVIFCIYCQKPIYYQSNINRECKYIKCPYSNCGQKFTKLKCCKCETQIYLDYCEEGKLIQCSKCKEQFREVKCPLLTCNNIIQLPKDYIEGNQIVCTKHNNILNQHFKFQKISCVHCSRSIIFNNSKGSYYIERQKLICPYEDCERRVENGDGNLNNFETKYPEFVTKIDAIREKYSPLYK